MKKKNQQKNRFIVGAVIGFVVLATGLAWIQSFEVSYWIKLPLSLGIAGGCIGIYALLEKNRRK